MGAILHCKYCDYKCSLWSQGLNYPHRNWIRMADHIKREHPEYADEADALVADYDIIEEQ